MNPTSTTNPTATTIPQHAKRFNQLNVPGEINPIRGDALRLEVSNCGCMGSGSLGHLKAFEAAYGGDRDNYVLTFAADDFVPVSIPDVFAGWVRNRNGQLTVVGRTGVPKDTDFIVFFDEDTESAAKLAEKFSPSDTLTGNGIHRLPTTYVGEFARLSSEERANFAPEPVDVIQMLRQINQYGGEQKADPMAAKFDEFFAGFGELEGVVIDPKGPATPLNGYYRNGGRPTRSLGQVVSAILGA